MIRNILLDLTKNFEVNKLTNLFRHKNNNFRHPNKNIFLEDEGFENTILKEELSLPDGNFIVIVSFCKFALNEKSSKKNQYEFAKKILRITNNDAGIFVFYDKNKKFRFSLIYQEYFGKKSQFSFYKRSTYFVDPKKINKTFIYQLEKADFSSIKNIKEAFSVEPLSKEFYQRIQTWYFWALSSKEIFFPNSSINLGMNLIRLITRLIFIWFIKEKDLIPEDLFDENKLIYIIKDFNKSTNYYNAILQNLFFATLNQEIKKRDWAQDMGYPYNKKNFGIKNLYRYEDKFLIDKKEVMKFFSSVPFLNGGLFDCLDKDDFRGEIIDGFTRRKDLQAKIPDYYFFLKEEKEVDLSEYSLGKRRINGLISILKNYNFTTDESTSLDQEIALDPEMLGKVFENLLAVYNPETSESARKLTGSYYTPREIVDFMVEESLFSYLKNKTNLDNDKLRLLLSLSDETPSLIPDEKNKIVKILADIKIIDPACGSGAFPVGILLRIVHTLQKIDKDNEIWREIQFQKALEETKIIFKDKEIEKIERENKLKEINEIFDESIKNPDYARKLFLIENCIYGIDIQPIATHIAKLRFFISLIIDQEKNSNKENFGIRSLPNLDTKFVTANSLINICLKEDSRLFNLDEKLHCLIDKLKQNYHLHFRAKTRERKKQIQEEIKKIRKEIAIYIKNKTYQHYENEIIKIDKSIESIKKEIEIIEKQDYQFTIMTQDNFFYQDKQQSINFKKNLIDKKNSQLKNLEKNKKELQGKLSGDEVEKIAKKVADFDIFDQNKSNSWFNPEWMFGLEQGFDIVIGNPPYISTKGVDEKDKKELQKQYGFADDTYNHFYFKGIQLLKDKGILAYISSKTFWTIQTKKILRELLLKNTILQLFDTANPFDSAMVDTCVAIVKKAPSPDEHTITFLDGKKDLNKPEIYRVPQNVYANAPNQVFFLPNDYNLKIYERFGKKVNELLNQWWGVISTSKNIEKNKARLESYRNSLKPGDITLLGLITEGGQGLATANNGKYIGVLDGTKWADHVRKQRPEKLLLASDFCKKQNIKNKTDAQRFLETLSEKEIRHLFDTLKEQYGRDVFGQGWLYRIVSKDEIADVENLTEDEKLNGIAGTKTFVPYDKGDKDGNRWYAPTPYYIDWSRENVKFLQQDPKARWQGYQFYFREGFCWSDIHTINIKCRIKISGIQDVKSMSLFSFDVLKYPDFYFVCILNSTFISDYVFAFIKNTQTFQINDGRLLPIIIPTDDQLKAFESIFNRAYNIQKQKFEGAISDEEAEQSLTAIQEKLDKMVEEMYMGENNSSGN